MTGTLFLLVFPKLWGKKKKYLASEDHDVLDGIGLQHRELVHYNEKERLMSRQMCAQVKEDVRSPAFIFRRQTTSKFHKCDWTARSRIRRRRRRARGFVPLGDFKSERMWFTKNSFRFTNSLACVIPCWWAETKRRQKLETADKTMLVLQNTSHYTLR